MGVKARISDIVAKFRAEGVTTVQSESKKVEKALAGVGDAGDKAAKGLDKAEKAGGGFGGRIVRGAGTATRALAGLAKRAAQTSAAVAAIGSAAFGGVMRKSIDGTVSSMEQLRRVTSLTRLPPEFVSFFERFGAESGLDKPDVAAIFSGLSAAAGEAAADIDSQFNKTFQSIGINVRDARGQMKSLATIFGELARAQALAKAGKISQSQFDFSLNQIFGDDDALKVSELLSRMNELGAKGIQQKFDAAKGSLVTEADVDAAKRLQAALVSVKAAFDTVARSISTKSATSVVNVLAGVTRIVERNANRIGKFFADSFVRTVVFLRDLVKVFTGYDFAKDMFPDREFQTTYTVVDRIKAGFDAVVSAILKAKDGVLAFVRDLKLIYDYYRTIAAGGNPFELTFGTEVGQKIFTFFQTVRETVPPFVQSVIDGFQRIYDGVKNTFDGVVDYVTTAWKDAKKAFDDGKGGDGLSFLGQAILQFREILDLTNKFADAFKAVFVDGKDAPDGFEWMERVRTILKELDEFLSKLGTAYEDFAKPVINAIDGIVERLTGMKLSVALLGLALLNAFSGGLLLKAIGSLTGLLFGKSGLGGRVVDLGLKLFGLGATGTAAATVAEGAAAAVGTAAGAATTTAATAATTAAGTAATTVATMLTGLATQLAVWAAGLGIGAGIGYFGTDALLGDWLRKRNDAKTKAAVDDKIRPAMDANLDRYGDKRASAAAAERAKQTSVPQMSGGYDMSQYRDVDDASAEVDRRRAATAPMSDALSSYTARQNRFDLSAANAAIDAKVAASVGTIDARNAQIVTDLQPVTVQYPDGRSFTGLYARDQADAMVRANRLRTTGAPG